MVAQLIGVLTALLLPVFADFVIVETAVRSVGVTGAAITHGLCQTTEAKATCSYFFTVISP